MSEPVAIRHLIPPDLLATGDLLVAVTGRSEARLVADRPLPELADHTHDELRDAGLTPAAAHRLACALELGRRLHIAPLRPGVQLKDAQQIFQAYEPHPHPGSVAAHLTLGAHRLGADRTREADAVSLWPAGDPRRCRRGGGSHRTGPPEVGPQVNIGIYVSGGSLGCRR